MCIAVFMAIRRHADAGVAVMWAVWLIAGAGIGWAIATLVMARQFVNTRSVRAKYQAMIDRMAAEKNDLPF